MAKIFRHLVCCHPFRYQPVTADEKWVDLLTKNQRECVLTESMLSLLSEHIGEGWEAVGIRLGLSYVCVERCRMSYSVPQMQVFSMLNKWRQKKGSKVTIEDLVSTLQNCTRVCTIDVDGVVDVIQRR